MSEREQLITALRASDFAGYRTGEAADLIESQAKELAECQARVVVLRDIVSRLGVYLPTELQPEVDAALSSTDTAAQTLRPKYIETTSCGRCEYEEADGSLIEQCPKCKAIDAAKEKP